MSDCPKRERFIDRLSYASTSQPPTAAQARRMSHPSTYQSAKWTHRFINRIARRQRFMRVQRAKFRADCRAGRGMVWLKGVAT